MSFSENYSSSLDDDDKLREIFNDEKEITKKGKYSSSGKKKSLPENFKSGNGNSSDNELSNFKESALLSSSFSNNKSAKKDAAENRRQYPKDDFNRDIKPSRDVSDFKDSFQDVSLHRKDVKSSVKDVPFHRQDKSSGKDVSLNRQDVKSSVKDVPLHRKDVKSSVKDVKSSKDVPLHRGSRDDDDDDSCGKYPPENKTMSLINSKIERDIKKIIEYTQDYDTDEEELPKQEENNDNLRESVEKYIEIDSRLDSEKKTYKDKINIMNKSKEVEENKLVNILLSVDKKIIELPDYKLILSKKNGEKKSGINKVLVHEAFLTFLPTVLSAYKISHNIHSVEQISNKFLEYLESIRPTLKNEDDSTYYIKKLKKGKKQA